MAYNNRDRVFLISEKSTPTNAEGEIGEFRFDDDFLYICTGIKTWKKIALVAL
jgi:hypothetical protein